MDVLKRADIYSKLLKWKIDLQKSGLYEARRAERSEVVLIFLHSSFLS